MVNRGEEPGSEQQKWSPRIYESMLILAFIALAIGCLLLAARLRDSGLPLAP